MFFGRLIFDGEKLICASIAFICFSILSSAIYIINDYRDIEKDRKHPVKMNRPLAKGTIKPKSAIVMFIICMLIVIGLSFYLGSKEGAICLAIYFGLNVAYSMGLKNIPIVDIVILASGFVIRVIYGGFITNIEISNWLYLVVVVGSLYMGLGKRRNEFKAHTDTREVLKYYNEAFLDKNMYVCVTLASVFYSLWTLEISDQRIIWTIPIFIVLLMCYSLNVERNIDGDPVEIILKDKVLISVILGYAVCIFALLYIV